MDCVIFSASKKNAKNGKSFLKVPILTKRLLQFFSKLKSFEMEEKRSKASVFGPFLPYHKSLLGTFVKILGPFKIWELYTLLFKQFHYLLNHLRINNPINFLIICI